MPESPETKGPLQVTSPTSMAGGTSTGVREGSRPLSGSNAGNTFGFASAALSVVFHCKIYIGKISKNVSPSYIMLIIQRLEDNKCRSR